MDPDFHLHLIAMLSHFLDIERLQIVLFFFAGRLLDHLMGQWLHLGTSKLREEL